jgi:hypothetical protein
MIDAATISRELTPEMADLLRAGAADHLGIVCSPGRVEKNWKLLRELQAMGFVRFPTIEQPWITDAGRTAIGAPSQAQADRARFVEMCSRRPRLVPERRRDPRTEFDYRSYRAMSYACTLVVKQPDARENPASTRVGRSLTSDPQYLGPKNSIVLPESEGRFVLALMPDWLIRRAGFSTYALPLDETDPAFTEEERKLWDRLRLVCYSVNARIRTAGRKRPEKFRYGESA